MRVYASFHPAPSTELRISRSDSGNLFFRALCIDHSSITPVDAQQAREMAALLNQIATEMEAHEKNAS